MLLARPAVTAYGGESANGPKAAAHKPKPPAQESDQVCRPLHMLCCQKQGVELRAKVFKQKHTRNTCYSIVLGPNTHQGEQ